MREEMLLGLCGSLRAGSLNRKLMAEAAGFWPGRVEEGSLRLPLYDGDLEAAGMPPDVRRLGEQVAAARAILIASPEYNKGPSGVLKNALDWLSRLKPNPVWGKPVAVISATGGRAGGERGQVMLRSMLVPHRAEVLTWPEVLVGAAEHEFDAEGRLTNPRYRAAVEQLMGRLHAVAVG